MAFAECMRALRAARIAIAFASALRACRRRQARAASAAAAAAAVAAAVVEELRVIIMPWRAWGLRLRGSALNADFDILLQP